MRKKIICIIIVICLLLAFGATVTIDWLYETFGHLSMDEIIFHIKENILFKIYEINNCYALTLPYL